VSFPFILILSAVVLALGAVTLWLRLRNSRDELRALAAYPALAAVNRSTLTWRYVGVGLGLAVVAAIIVLGNWAQALVATPAILACVIEACMLVGELATYTRARQPGTAGLERRRTSDYLPWRLLGLVIGLAVALTVLIVVGRQLAGPSGRDYQAWLCSEDFDSVTCQVCAQVGPFLGAHYSTGMAVTLVVAAGLTGLLLIVTTRRPRNGANTGLAGWDDALRRRGSRTALATLAGAIGASLAIAAVGIHGGQELAANSLDPAGWMATSCVDRAGQTGYYQAPVQQAVFGHPLVYVALIVCLVVGLLVAVGAAVVVLSDVVPTHPDGGSWSESINVKSPQEVPEEVTA